MIELIKNNKIKNSEFDLFKEINKLKIKDINESNLNFIFIETLHERSSHHAKYHLLIQDNIKLDIIDKIIIIKNKIFFNNKEVINNNYSWISIINNIIEQKGILFLLKNINSCLLGNIYKYISKKDNPLLFNISFLKGKNLTIDNNYLIDLFKLDCIYYQYIFESNDLINNISLKTQLLDKRINIQYDILEVSNIKLKKIKELKLLNDNILYDLIMNTNKYWINCIGFSSLELKQLIKKESQSKQKEILPYLL